MDPVFEVTAAGRPRQIRRRHAVVIGLVMTYVLLAAACRPLTGPALAAVLVAGVPLCWLGVRHPPRHAPPVGGRSAAVWLGLLALGVAVELGLWLGPDDLAHPTLSTLADPILNTYPGRVLGYSLWVGSGVWLVNR